VTGSEIAADSKPYLKMLEFTEPTGEERGGEGDGEGLESRGLVGR